MNDNTNKKIDLSNMNEDEINESLQMCYAFIREIEDHIYRKWVAKNKKIDSDEAFDIKCKKALIRLKLKEK